MILMAVQMITNDISEELLFLIIIPILLNALVILTPQQTSNTFYIVNEKEQKLWFHFIVFFHSFDKLFQARNEYIEQSLRANLHVSIIKYQTQFVEQF